MRHFVSRAALVAALSVVAGLLATLPLACGDDGGTVTADAAPSEASDLDAATDADAPVVARGSRVLGLTVDITDLNFPANLDVARDAGAQTTAVTFAWDEIERAYDAGAPDPDAGDAGDDGGDASAPVTTALFNPGVHISNLVLSDRGVEATLSLEAFDVGGARLPVDLTGRTLDDATVQARYDALVDYAFDQMHDTKLTALVVASGADAWVAADAKRASALASFVTHAAAHAHTLRPGVKVGFTVDALDATVAHANELAPAWAASDFAGVDEVPPVEVVATKPSPALLAPADFARIASAVPGNKPILLRQAGYPSSAACGSDEATQAAFVTATFRAWDAHEGRFFAVVFRELDDATSMQAAALAARRGRSDAPFLALAQSLGMRASAAKPKASLGVLRREAHARGW